ncbi:TPA: sigma 54-interacting transcriptional regulator [Klebsiella quasipneumoniae subsp. quasipneumoniae]|uniref:sigma 54-interacting transcriptional regulator n=1 Tax=Klebsiella quasipneumoniae TaxID=1463165 RepID=UPI001F4D6EFB|nr:sigma 54-interacting transcriptional regulator [Klebsiella quasipneumoniae]HBR1673893.1 sigma 54-interacting transcriptional regulator [Klebsiella quasipneumoniae subsp. quasipneumoniae]MCH9292258.1 sigma 54-interacting transcriptional regulator [Klebsiella quasipneumoniae]MDZ3014379.1 sigma 54-interacting transcriptional regulator [Klebsiella quasipneumoniae]HBV4315412.1 AAA domain-containing protein [Klebsiella quasipneumoniae]HDH1544082.1 sigma 54-interacting transcriptional regulator [K
MKNNEIVIFSVSSTITQRIINVLIERKLEIPVYEFRYSDVLNKANEMIQSGTRIIISRGGTAALLRNNIPIPVIEIAHDFHGVYRILQEAKNTSQKIAAIGFPQFCRALRHYQSMTNDEFKICQVYNHHDIENVIKNLSENDYHMVIGGLTVAEMAKKYNLNVIEGDADNNSIEQAINEAHGLLKYINRENLKLVMSHAALNQSREGIMCVDQLGEIIHINAIGMTLFQCQVGDKLFKKEVFKDIYASMINESNVKEQAIEINGTLVSLSVRHFSNRHNSYAVITGLSQESTLWQQTTSKKSHLRGYATSYSFDNIIAQSPIMHQVIQKARLCAQHELPVHILGDTGTGKELFAQSIHHVSARSHGPFVALNCAAIPESLLESELFGYAEGAFTNARKGGKPGVFEMATNGTVFIDEISEAPLSVQVKLLRVLQEKQFSRLGGDTLLSADFRLITASNKDLGQLVACGEFRQDLYYRINILELQLPSLRERPEDIMVLIHHLLQQQNKHLTFTADAVNCLQNYDWPGNIRELQAVIYRLIVLLDGNTVNKEVLQQISHLSPACHQSVSLVSDHTLVADESDLLKKQEKQLIASVIEKTDGDRTRASAILGISPTTLWRKLKQHNISG